MLEVHPPDHAPHTLRDFLLHLLTITVGLLIALSLEAIVEWRHHVHLRHEAEENIRRELEANRKDLAAVLASAPEEQKSMRVMLDFLKQREQNRATDVKTLRMGMKLMTPQDASWQTANATNAVSYMDFEEVQRFAGAYGLQKQLQTMQNGALQPIVTLQGMIATDDPNTMKPADASVAIAEVRAVMAHIETIRQMGQELDETYAEALKEK